MPKNTLTYEQLISLCDDYVNHFESKSGDDYIKALSSVFNLVNVNDKPFDLNDIIVQPTLKEFNFNGKNDFRFICKLHAEPMRIDKSDRKRKNEKIIADHFYGNEEKDIFENSMGVAYMITCTLNGKEHIIKFGQTRTPFKARLGSYNCGVVNNWRTASTTNIKILQSMVTTRQVFNLYLYDCSEPETIVWHGVSQKVASPKSLVVEDIIIKKFIEQFGKKPLANVQADATGSDK